MSERLTDRRAVLLAIDAALQWEGSMLSCLSSDDPQVAECRKLIAAYRRVQHRISGNKLTISEMACQKALAGSRLVGLAELREMLSAPEAGE